MLADEASSLNYEALKPYIEALKQNQSFKKLISRKLVKKYQQQFKNATQAFLEDPQLPLESLTIEKVSSDTLLRTAKKLLIANQDLNEQFKLICQDAVFKYEHEYNIKNRNDKTAKILYDKIITEVKNQVHNLAETYSSQKDDSIWSVKRILEIFDSFKNQKRDALMKVTNEFFDIMHIDHYKEIFEELNDAKYEHLEQAKECEDVEIERIQEADTLLNSVKKGSDIYEVLSYLKAGVPNSKRLKFYKLYNKTVLSLVESKECSPFSKETEDFVNNYIHIFELSLNKLLAKAAVHHEYFVYENNLKSLYAYFIKNYNKFMFSCKNNYLGYVPIEGLESFILIAAAFSIDINDCKRYLKPLLQKVYKPMYDMDIDNPDNILNLLFIFERAFIIDCNELYMHLREIGVFPVNYAAEWISQLFVGYVSYQQVLLLVDRILGFENLAILPFTALGIFKYMETELMKVTTKDEVDETLYLNGIKILKALNLALFENNLIGEDEDRE